MEEEKDLFSKSKVNANGERIFVFDDMPENEFKDDQVGENFVFDISEKYLGEALDANDGLFETEFEGYTFSKPKLKKKIVSQVQVTQYKFSLKKPWWKFW